MLSDRKIAANRANARKSTGPTTAAGKRRSSQNATTHGLTATTVVIRGEDPDRFAALVESYRRRFRPENDDERAMVDELAAASWRYRRVTKVDGPIPDPDAFAGEFAVNRYLTSLHRIHTRVFDYFLQRGATQKGFERK